jgi:hypothetical protein
MGQSNIAAGATIGSNHNSRSPDGELIAARGFWPGLCVSLKHNSKFASFTIISQGNYSAELNIPIPFCLVAKDLPNKRIVIIPAFWFMYNMYALARNAWKYQDRDRRTEKLQKIDYDYLAPDTINELFDALQTLNALTPDEKGCATVKGWENNTQPALITKIPDAKRIFKELICFYSCSQVCHFIRDQKITSLQQLIDLIPARTTRSKWINIGGQLIRASRVNELKKVIKNGGINSWGEVHDFYITQGAAYDKDKLEHAFTCLLEILNITPKQLSEEVFLKLLNAALETKTWMTKGIYTSREKDFTNPYRKMVYDSSEEMNKVLGKLDENSFIQSQFKDLEDFKVQIADIKKSFRL